MIKALRGTKDILPDNIGAWNRIELFARDIFAKYGYREIRTPIIEDASLFIRSIGDYTDIVQKEMYIFKDRGGRAIALRPEATASVVRAYIENSLGHNRPGITKLFYIGPMFRSERPQKGRQRQFYQLGVEAIGSDSPFLDVEVILLSERFLRGLNISNFSLKINSLGCERDKAKLIEAGRKVVRPYVDSLCDDCRERYKKNVLRVIDCKNQGCKRVAEKIELEPLLCNDCKVHFNAVKMGLKSAGVKFDVDQRIVRGLDYYTKTVFEIIHKGLGAKDAICAGGRYNNLIRDLGGEDTPAIGFAVGMDRLVMALQERHEDSDKNIIFIVRAGERFYEPAFRLITTLRDAGLYSDTDYGKKSLKAQMRMAEKLGFRYVIIFAEDELKRGNVVLRDMQKREQKEVNLNHILKELVPIYRRQAN